MKVNISIHKVQIVFLLFFLGSTISLNAQEINAKVVIEYSQIQGTNVSVFTTLETAVTEFINNKRWTNDEYLPNERIDCNFFINLMENEGTTYSGNITITARRPIHNATISTTLLNLVDNDFSFTYKEFDQLLFNPNSLTQDLTAVIGFYVYTVLGLDADSFKEFGGDPYFDVATSIVNTAQGSTGLAIAGWDRLKSNQNRSVLITQIQSPEFIPYRSYLYQYHRLGLDVMADDPEKGANAILNGLKSIEEVARKTPSSYSLLLFFDVKNQEIQSIIREMDVEDEAVLAQKKKVLAILKKVDQSRVNVYDKLAQ